VVALAHHDPEHEQLQRTLVVPRLQELLDDPELGGTAEDALGEIGIYAVRTAPGDLP
jgi:hypothetical protein